MSATLPGSPGERSRLGALVDWIDARFPMTRLWKEHASEYYAPKNFNFWYYFGVLASVVLVLQIVTGIFLTMNYKPSAADAFASVEYIMRDVEWGWLIRYMHSTGASAFFIVVYLHMFRGLMYGSFKNPRELVWIFGMLIYLCLMAEAFFGYLLPWGNMSYWGAQVIVSLFGAIPGIGESLVEWIRGDYYISDITLNRFFALHVVALPIALIFLVIAHILALHEVGSNNPDGVEIKKVKGPDGHPVDGIPFHPYYTVHDLVAVIVFAALFTGVMFFAPEMGGYFLEHANFEPANPLQHAGAHRAGVVLHAVLRNLARRAEQAVRRDADGRRGAGVLLRAVARPLAREVDPLSRLVVPRFPVRVRHQLPGSRLSRAEAGDSGVHQRRAGLLRGVFRVLHPDAVVHEGGPDQAGAGAGDLSCALRRTSG